MAAELLYSLRSWCAYFHKYWILPVHGCSEIGVPLVTNPFANMVKLVYPGQGLKIIDTTSLTDVIKVVPARENRADSKLPHQNCGSGSCGFLTIRVSGSMMRIYRTTVIFLNPLFKHTQ